MEPFNKIEAYCSILCEQIRWKIARGVVGEEIKTHLLDQRDAYMFEGDDEIVATDKAIVQMGDPVFIGEELDKTHKPKPQWAMLIITGVLMFLGCIINYRVSNTNDFFVFNTTTYIIAIVILFVCYLLDFTFLGKYAKWIYIFLLITSYISIFNGNLINGRKVWTAPIVTVTLSYMYIIYPLSFALMLYTLRNKGLFGILKCGLLYIPFAVALVWINTTSGLVLYTISCLTILTFAICRNWFDTNKIVGLSLVWGSTILFVAYIIIKFLMFSTFRSNRFRNFFDPNIDPYGYGYVYQVSRGLISNSVWIGQGQPIEITYDASVLFGSDLTLTYLISKYGLIVLLLISIVLVVFISIGTKKILKEKSMLGTLVTLTTISMFTIQSIFSILANLGYGLVFTTNVPFLSNSGTSMCLNAMLIGFMLSVFRTGDVVRDYLILPQKPKSKSFDLFNYKIKFSIEKTNK